MTDLITASPDPVSPGGTLTICFTLATLANQTITLDLNNALPPGDQDRRTSQVQIELNAAGYGCTTWTVPASGWDGILIQHPDSDDHAVAVNPP